MYNKIYIKKTTTYSFIIRLRAPSQPLWKLTLSLVYVILQPTSPQNFELSLSTCIGRARFVVAVRISGLTDAIMTKIIKTLKNIFDK